MLTKPIGKRFKTTRFQLERNKVDIVVTTIFEPQWLDGYLGNIRMYGREEQVTVRIIIDRKTPPSVIAAAESARQQGFKVDCPSLHEQEVFLQRFGLQDDFIPWNSDNRRNIGFMRAYESGCDVLISIDDDNYCLADSDFVGSHLAALNGSLEQADDVLFASNGSWFNICGQLQSQCNDAFFARGYPYHARNPDRQAQLERQCPDSLSSARVVLNAGLWLDDPDVDAASRLVQGPRVSGAAHDAVVLAPECWSPINTQNTALRRDAIPAYYYVRMGFPIKGLSIDRFGDIISGYLVQKCAKHLGDAIRFGGPVAEHRRSPHNLFKDLYHELAGMVLIEELMPWLLSLKLQGSTYQETYAHLAQELAEASNQFQGFIWDEGGREFLISTSAHMQRWLQAVRVLDGNQ